MPRVKVRWQKWFGEGEKELTFPDSWDVSVAAPCDAPDIGEDGIAQAFASPLGSLPLADLARGHQNAVIAIDDITRPTPTQRVLRWLLEELEKGGIDREKVCIIVASGAHRPSTRMEMAHKLGREILNTIDVRFHVPYENLAYLGLSSWGTPVHINRTFCEGDLKIAIGAITPHVGAGFGGGRKLVSVGLASTETLKVYHSRDPGWLRTGCVQGNPQHDDLEEMMHMVGLDFAVETVVTTDGGVAAMFVGEPTACFLAGVEKTWEIYATDMPQGADIVVLNAYPKDFDLLQAINALNVTLYPNMDIVRPDGSIVWAAACPEGEGLHFLATYGMSGSLWFTEESFKGRHVILYSPNLSDHEAHRHFPRVINNYRHWEDVIGELGSRHGARARVTVYPCATLQLNPANRHNVPVRL